MSEHDVDDFGDDDLVGMEEFVKPVSQEKEQQIDESLGLQMISIRLPKQLIEIYKAMSNLHGIGYQPLMRDVLSRWAEAELKTMFIASQKQNIQNATEETQVEPPPMKKAA